MSSHPAGGTAGVGDPPLLNIANALTVLRLLLVPVFVVALFVDGGEDVMWRLVAFAVFVIAAATDRLDGQLARSRGLVTWFGALVDPIADKALMGAALIGLSILGVLPWWATIVIVVRELGITALRFVVIRRRGVIPASRGGKAKTVAQTVAIGLFLLPLPELLGPGAAATAVLVLQWAVMAVALVLTVVTGADYVRKAVRPRTA
ncbi:CDP-diacylglycerol--glycerol-3-phosphate 3-phosphatidyltransferase [Pseudonocardia alni]|jgi:CDP-diacylglycerol--glycerol-3-phosphate 3-phosphatidyltransferase|uniref:CDP-diacylglycerol--glycerol-3-phosphate 3-phosphatidyltransferase n=1 Tax=Pseudonocardia alni TaxID=33907 RepID=A0AA44UU15_PSEA5|nr:CDP-diacylglycerol--glycerol-3-phosphate 3-phosphatidyltransferase [Pseudonocardia alni]PKB33184.1 CDP-diacylglycerol--glycerol-3-phosphate 3-phosphatidyltransferase [Pseudonocardia alni]